MKTTSKFTCPMCGNIEKVTMPDKGCQHFYQCSSCKETISPKEGDCCVFCSYGDTKCPVMQEVN